MLSVDDALNRILGSLSPVGIETVPLTDGLDRVLAVDMAARRTQPPHPVSSMDGYAVRFEDVARTPAALDCVATIPAGSSSFPRLPPGTCARIFTGAPIPPDADTVVIQENVTVEKEGRITVIESAREIGQWVRPAGLDFGVGDVLLHAGKRLGPADIGMAAAMNHPWLSVRRRPRVAILATGDEVVLPGEPLTESSLPSSNSLQLMALVRRVGGEPLHIGIVPDDPALLRDRVLDATRVADIIVTSGGASVGDHDHVQRLLGSSSDGKLDFWRIAMRPGKPLLFGKVGQAPFLGLPGNPVSCFVCGLIFLIPAIRRLSGRSVLDILSERAAEIIRLPVSRALGRNDQRQDYLRSVIEVNENDEARVRPFEKQDSSMTSILARANALVIRPANAEPVPEGALVPVLRI